MRILLAAPLLFLGLAGCMPVTSFVTPFVAVTTPKPADCSISVMAQAPADRKYLELGIISAEGPATLGGDLNSLLPELTRRACELGADSIIIRSVEPRNPLYARQGATAKAVAVAIKFVE